MSKKAEIAIAERVAKIWWNCRTWGNLERAAGVTDRIAFWHGKTEDQVRAELRSMIADRLRSGELIAGGD